MISKFFLFPYYLTLKIRNRLYDNGSLKSEKFDIPVIAVGNVTSGGTGKTPMVELMVKMLSDGMKVAVLSRGYRRKSKGFVTVSVDDDALRVGDEALQVKKKFPQALVAVDKDRNHGIREILSLGEEEKPDVIILDDAMQYRRLNPDCTVGLIDYYKPIFKDELLPLGKLRDLPEQIRRADTVVLTKAPEFLNEWEIEQARKVNRLRPEQDMYFTKLRYCTPKAVFEDAGDKRYIYSKEVYLFTGIADDRLILFHLSENYDWIAHKSYPDHHYFSKGDIRHLKKFAAKHPRALLLTTEKDAQRLLSCGNLGDEVSRRLFYLPVEMVFLNWDYYFQFKAKMIDVIKPSPAQEKEAAAEETVTEEPVKEEAVPEPEVVEPEVVEPEEKQDFLKPMEPVNGGLLF